jgi:Putative auto-transporter adhesin, head GIN domain
MRRLAALAVGGLLMAGCVQVNFNGVVGSGPLETETRAVAAFSRVSAGGGVKVEVTIGPTQSVELEAQANLLPIIETQVREGTLEISSTENYSAPRGITVTITVPAIDGITLSGGAQGRISGLGADRLQADVSGGAALRGDGVVATLEISASGGAQVHLFDVAATAVELSASGGAQLEVTAAERVSGAASGGSRVTVHGDATVDVSTSGGSSVGS